MSRFGFLLLVFSCFRTAFSQVPSYVPSNGLVGWWPFNGNANDESGNGNNGTVNGATLTNDRFGNAGKAYSFDGVNDYIESSYMGISGNSSRTFCGWFKTTFISSTQPSPGKTVLMYGPDSPYSTGDRFEIEIGHSCPGLSVDISGVVLTKSGNIGYSDNSWQFFTIVMNTNDNLSNIKYYLNGSLLTTNSCGNSANLNTFTQHFMNIGRNYIGSTGQRYFPGSLDDIGIWNRALTQQEINELYTSSDPFDVSAITTTVCAGQPTTLSVQSVSGTITALNCASATNSGTLTAGTAASGVSSSVPYTGGNGGAHNGQTVTSTGVTGLTATLTAGTFASGNGSLTYTITGTPSTSGAASFALNIGGQTCTLNLSVASNLSSQYPSGSVFCASGPTVIVDVTNPTTGKTWMDRNLGASQKATASSDAAAYGDLYQWGRRSDGHQCRNSATTTTLSSTDQPSHGSFILTNSSPNDWRSPQNNTRWQGLNGVNNPCPSGYRIPTVAEFDAERLSWSSNNAAGAIASPLKLPMAGRRVFSTGSIDPGSPSGFYWTSGVSLPYCQDQVFSATSALPASNLQWITFGDSVRCIKN